MNNDLRELIYKNQHRLNKAIELLNKDETVSKKNKETLMRFKNYGLAKGLSAQRIIIYLTRLRVIARELNKPFKQATREDIETVFAKLNSKNLAQLTIVTYQKIIKAFYRWLYDLEPQDQLPKSVAWILVKRPPNKLEKKDLLTQEEVGRMIAAAQKTQYKALISVLYEGSLRPGELLTIEKKHIVVEEDVIKISVAGKTEHSRGRRDIFLFNSYDLLVRWLESHPLRKKSNYPLWVKGNNNVFGMRYLGKIIKELAEKANIKKRVFPYLFRHSRGTELYKKHGEAIAKKFMGHSASSRMASVYNHLCDEDVYEALSGKKVNINNNIKNCPRCDHKNTYSSDRCSKCGLSLTLEEASKPRLDEEQIKSIVASMLKDAGYNIAKIEKV